ncbi:MAG: phenylacetaldehyde dehydrogenase [Gammaproteobacteria bacterium RIFCSPLOWO2_12_FULL_52_10]|nr:MAG: phenylacetaldehyde dehydrogenase [Gammaproteobacteria bacterium RIFCSPLOWO2_12_FULL_52_10]
MPEYRLFINGAWVDSVSGTTTDNTNPADGGVIARIHQADKADFDKAIAAADAAFKTWGKTLANEREKILMKAADILESGLQDYINAIVTDTGGTLLKATFEAGFVVNMLRSAAGEARRIFGETIPADSPGMFSMSIRKPLGVIAGISPFNFPFILSTKKVCLALAAGNTFVLKPPNDTPIVGLMIGELFEAAGLPPGVLNIVPGKSSVFGDIVTSDPRIKMVTFTGSTATGRQLAVKAAANGKKITLEMGGKSPFIVLADANVDFAVDTAAFGIFLHQGQICMAGTRIIVEAPVYDEFCRKFAKKAAALKVGDPKDPTTVIGPLISASKCAGVDALVQAAIKQGARVVAGGKYDGPYYEPTVVIDVDNSMKIFYEECFAPVVVVCKARDHLEALALANDNEYGLSSAVMTNDMDKMMFFAQNLETGMTHFNHTTVYDEPHVPFGGVKNSGFGREGGHYSMEEMTEVKWITISGSTPHPYPF